MGNWYWKLPPHCWEKYLKSAFKLRKKIHLLVIVTTPCADHPVFSFHLLFLGQFLLISVLLNDEDRNRKTHLTWFRTWAIIMFHNFSQNCASFFLFLQTATQTLLSSQIFKWRGHQTVFVFSKENLSGESNEATSSFAFEAVKRKMLVLQCVCVCITSYWEGTVHCKHN